MGEIVAGERLWHAGSPGQAEVALRTLGVRVRARDIKTTIPERDDQSATVETPLERCTLSGCRSKPVQD